MMPTLAKLALGGLLFVLGLMPLRAETRIVSTSGAITETVYALGAGEFLVGVDLSSVYPDAATKLPMIGYARILSSEGILSTKPSLILANSDAGPEGVMEQLRASGVKMILLSNAHDPKAAAERVRVIGREIGKTEEAEKLVTEMEAQLRDAAAFVASQPSRPKVMFIYTRGGGIMNVAGRGTGAEAMIELAGGVNAVQGCDGYKPLTAEGALLAAPDFILVSSRGLESSGGVEELLTQPGLLQTPAGSGKRVVAMDDLFLLGFGPRLGLAVKELSEKLHPAQ
jgi:iron complex transport system substrate-binding protein